MPSPRPLREVLSAVGEELGPTDWLALDLEHLHAFAKATYMTEEDEVDLTTSKANRLGGELVDGFLTLGLVIHFNWRLFPFRDEGTWALNYGLDRVRFPAPVYISDRVRGRLRIDSASERSDDSILVRAHAVIEIEGRSKPALAADWLCLYLNGEPSAR